MTDSSKQAEQSIADAIRELAKTRWRPNDTSYKKHCVAEAIVELQHAENKLKEEEDDE